MLTRNEDSAELGALHSYYIEDMARNYATDCSDPSLEEVEAVRTHGLSPSEKRESVRLHHKDGLLGPLLGGRRSPLPQRQRISDDNTM